MPDMPGLVARPRFMRLHDAYLNESTETRRRYAYELFTGKGLAEVYSDLRVGKAADWRHLKREFYAEEGPLAYWPYDRYGYLGNKEEILRQGALETIRVAEGLPESQMTRGHFRRPCDPEPVTRLIETWWMCSGNRFEINVLNGETQVTMMILTPAMPNLPDSRKPMLPNDGFIWTVADKEVLTRYIGEYREDQKRKPKLKNSYNTTRHARERKKLGRINKFTD